VEVERTELANVQVKKGGMASVPTCRDQKQFANHLMLRGVETFLVVNDKEKREQGFVQVRVDELNRLNQRLTPRNVKETMLKAGNYVCACDRVQRMI
jgi:hypothetical protein